MARAAYDPMRPRPAEGQDRPTKERISKGSYRTVPTEDAGRYYAMDDSACIVRVYRKAGWITEDQAEAADKYRELAHDVLGSPCQRSCLDDSPVGHEGDEVDTRHIRKRDEWDTAQRAMSARSRDVLLDWLWQERPVADQRSMCEGLDSLCGLWKIGA